MRHIPFDRLPQNEGMVYIHGLWMTQEEYDQVGWLAVLQYTTDTGTKAIAWVAPLEGLQRWSRIVHERREADIKAAMTRRARDEEWSEQIVAGMEK